MWFLVVRNDPENHLFGKLQGDFTYDVRGVAPPHAYVTGFFIEEAGETIAVVQVEGEKRVLLARELDSRRRDQLIPALAALLLIDERARK